MGKRTGFLFVVRFLNNRLLSKYTPPSSTAECSAVGKSTIRLSFMLWMKNR